MSASEPLAASVNTTGSAAGSTWWLRVEDWLERAGDHLNPILVKEARQALKSKQFVLTFALVLLAAWAWSVGGVLLLGPEANFQSGQSMFFGYLLILAFPLMVVVPFGAFQSLSAEREDRTFEMLAISTLRPWQFVSGKLASAMLQMLVYLSAVAPCLAFTYMLRGIDILAILMMTGYVVLASIGLSAIALLLATLTSEKHWQSVLSVLLIWGLMYCLMGSAAVAHQSIRSVWPFDDATFWYANAAVLTAYLSYLALAITATAAQLSFASDNRSTRLRVILLIQQGLWIGWLSGVWFSVGTRGSGPLFSLLFMFTALPLLQWAVVGALMTGESPELSRRVQRNLPKSFFGRGFLTWFNPGPGTGYVFVVGNLLTIWLAVVVAIALLSEQGTATLAALFSQFPPAAGTDFERVFHFATLGVCYVIFYLGLGRLLLGLARRFSATSLFLAGLVNFLLVLSGTALPMVIQYSSDPPVRDYTLWQTMNPLWTLADLAAGRNSFTYSGIVFVVVVLAAICVFLANLPQVIREVRFVRVDKPRRVQEEDAAAVAVAQPAAPVKRHPWD